MTLSARATSQYEMDFALTYNIVGTAIPGLYISALPRRGSRRSESNRQLWQIALFTIDAISNVS